MLKVTAAILKKEGKVLICQRSSGDKWGLLWEFPGGKVEEGETLEQCIIREMQEELSIRIEVERVFAQTVYYFDGKDIQFTFFEAAILEGTLTRNVHHDMRWVSGKELLRYEFMPPDVEVARRLTES